MGLCLSGRRKLTYLPTRPRLAVNINEHSSGLGTAVNINDKATNLMELRVQ